MEDTRLVSKLIDLRSLTAAVALTAACGSTASTNAPSGEASGAAGVPVTAGAPASAAGSPSTAVGGGGAGSGGSSGGTEGGVTAGNGGSAVAGSPGSAGTSLVGNGGNTGALTVQLDQPKQKMDGFGISNMFAHEELTDAELDAMFDPDKGIGLSILRMGMSSRGEPQNTSTFADAKRAVARGVKTLMVSIPTAPAECKTNGSENDGGHLISDDGGACYERWSSTIAAFPAKVKSEVGIDLYALSIGNEPDFASCGQAKPCNGSFVSMLYTADEAAAFLRVVAPKLRAASPNLKIMPPEPRQWLRLWTPKSAADGTDPLDGKGYDYGHVLARDAQVWGSVDMIAVHQYDTQLAEPWPSDVPDIKPIWQTEMSGTKYFPEAGPSRDIDNGIVIASWIHDAVVNGPASAWLWFWYKAPFTDDNEGLRLKDGSDTKRHYTLGNFSKFIRPGYVRVNISGSIGSDVLLSAFKADDGSVVIVAINKSSSDVALPIAISGTRVPTQLAPWVTSTSDNLAERIPVPVTGGAFTATLAAKTVTTFVGK